ncbi:DUF2268 domain-containing putative Zn-dependent protease [Flavobacterium sp. 7A]|uniref:gliding motility protein GldB-related protein n=1 Tax=Flavobacterium sp. 7A TaxID=2940571 RepID=UPI002226218E|nr:DUF2268 domain-containing putative Zn-dependent protease [Flavobacterium sp. 7A]MCW2119272.1 hypothetical protein [Flavobacterium sp. 7A]
MKNLLLLFTALIFVRSSSQNKKFVISTVDITNYWQAYDSIQCTTDRTKQLRFVQEIYLDKASKGEKDFMESRNHSPELFLNNILNYPKFWISLRPLTAQIQGKRKEIEKVMTRFANLYPSFKQPDIYFTIGCLNSGGTTEIAEILIGSEIACSTAAVDASELSSWHQSMFNSNGDIVNLVAHEAGHTQQKGGDYENDENSNLLGKCIKEGSCDFISELVVQKPVNSPYMEYGNAHEEEIWRLFQLEMLGQNTKNWLYNGDDAPNGIADLGYFIGYKICKSYYESEKDKKKALKEIIELEYTPESVMQFFVLSQRSKNSNR